MRCCSLFIATISTCLIATATLNSRLKYDNLVLHDNTTTPNHIQIRCYQQAGGQWLCPDPLSIPEFTLGSTTPLPRTRTFTVDEDYLLDGRNWEQYPQRLNVSLRLLDYWVRDYMCSPTDESDPAQPSPTISEFCRPSETDSQLHIFFMLGVGINEQQDASTWLQLRFLTTFAYSKAKIHLVYNPSFCRASFDTVRQLLAIPPCMRKRGFMQRAYQKISGLLLAGHKVLVVSDSYGGLPAARLAERFSQQHSTSEPPKLPVDNLRFLTFASIAVPKPQRVLGIRMLHLVNLNDIARRCNRLHRPRDMNGRYFIFDRMRSVIWTQLINQHLVHSWLLCGNAEQWREHFSYNKLARRMLRLIKSFALGEPYDNRIDN